MECEFKFIQQWRAKLLFHIEQQLNISKMLRSALPNHRTMTSIFLYSGIDIDNKPILFIWLNISICGQKNIRTTMINAFLMGYL